MKALIRYNVFTFLSAFCFASFDITRSQTGDFYQGFGCENNGTVIVNQDATQSMFCAKTLKEGGCGLRFEESNGIAFIRQQTKQLVTILPGKHTSRFCLKDFSPEVHALLLQDYPMNIYKSVWNNSTGVQVVNMSLTRETVTNSKIVLSLTEHWTGILVKIFVSCKSLSGRLFTNNDDCVLMKYEGLNTLPLSMALFKPTISTFRTTASSTAVPIVSNERDDTLTVAIMAAISVGVFVLVLFLLVILYCQRRKNKKMRRMKTFQETNDFENLNVETNASGMSNRHSDLSVTPVQTIDIEADEIRSNRFFLSSQERRNRSNVEDPGTFYSLQDAPYVGYINQGIDNNLSKKENTFDSRLRYLRPRKKSLNESSEITDVTPESVEIELDEMLAGPSGFKTTRKEDSPRANSPIYDTIMGGETQPMSANDIENLFEGIPEIRHSSSENQLLMRRLAEEYPSYDEQTDSKRSLKRVALPSVFEAFDNITYEDEGEHDQAIYAVVNDKTKLKNVSRNSEPFNENTSASVGSNESSNFFKSPVLNSRRSYTRTPRQNNFENFASPGKSSQSHSTNFQTQKTREASSLSSYDTEVQEIILKEEDDDIEEMYAEEINGRHPRNDEEWANRQPTPASWDGGSENSLINLDQMFYADMKREEDYNGAVRNIIPPEEELTETVMQERKRSVVEMRSTFEVESNPTMQPTLKRQSKLKKRPQQPAINTRRLRQLTPDNRQILRDFEQVDTPLVGSPLRESSSHPPNFNEMAVLAPQDDLNTGNVSQIRFRFENDAHKKTMRRSGLLSKGGMETMENPSSAENVKHQKVLNPKLFDFNIQVTEENRHNDGNKDIEKDVIQPNFSPTSFQQPKSHFVRSVRSKFEEQGKKHQAKATFPPPLIVDKEDPQSWFDVNDLRGPPIKERSNKRGKAILNSLYGDPDGKMLNKRSKTIKKTGSLDMRSKDALLPKLQEEFHNEHEENGIESSYLKTQRQNLKKPSDVSQLTVGVISNQFDFRESNVEASNKRNSFDTVLKNKKESLKKKTANENPVILNVKKAVFRYKK